MEPSGSPAHGAVRVLVLEVDGQVGGRSRASDLVAAAEGERVEGGSRAQRGGLAPAENEDDEGSVRGARSIQARLA